MTKFRDLRTSILVHITDREAAKSIVTSGVMRCSSKGMLGPGVYFAENKQAADLKAHHKGAIVVCAVNLGKLYEVYGPERQLSLSQLKTQNYDSVRGYKSKSPECKHFNTGTEFCVFEGNRITPLFAQITDAHGTYCLFRNKKIIEEDDFPIDNLVIEVNENKITISDTNNNVFSTIVHPEPLMKGRKIIFTNEGDFDFTKVIHRL